MRLGLLGFILLTCIGCESVFVSEPITRQANTLSIESLIKKQIHGLSDGRIKVCFNDDEPWEDVETLAVAACARLGLRAQWRVNNKWQCRWSAPHQAIFQCVYVAENGTITVPNQFAVYGPAQAKINHEYLQIPTLGATNNSTPP